MTLLTLSLIGLPASGLQTSSDPSARSPNGLFPHVAEMESRAPVLEQLPDNTVAMLTGLGLEVGDLYRMGVDRQGRSALAGTNADGDVCLVLKDARGAGATGSCTTVSAFLDRGLTVYGGQADGAGAATLHPDGWGAAGPWDVASANLLMGPAGGEDRGVVTPGGTEIPFVPMPATVDAPPPADAAPAEGASSAATNVYYRVYENEVVPSGEGAAITSGTSTQYGGQSRTAIADSVVYGSVYAPGGYKIRNYGGDGHVVAYAIGTTFAYTTCYHVNFSSSSRAMSCFYTSP